jgi:hypothetical protein
MLIDTKTATRRALREITSAASGRRIVISAYVGSNPLEYVADPAGVEVYCSNNPVGTDPDGIEDLLGEDAAVWFVPRLHARVYWSENAGALVGSANLSTNALGDEGLFETLYHTWDIDIDALLKRMRQHAIPVKVTPAILEQFRRTHRRVRGHVVRPSVRRAKDIPTFDQWLRNQYRKSFSVVFWTDYSAPDLTATEREAVRDYHERHDTGLEDYHDSVAISRPVIDLPGDEDVLCVKLLKGDRITTQGTAWMRCELRTVVNTGRGGKGRRTRLIQVRPRTGRVPFQPSGETLGRALTAFYNAHPIGAVDGTIFGTGSRNERWLIEAAGT